MATADRPDIRRGPVLIITRPRRGAQAADADADADDARERELRARGIALRPFPLIRILPPVAPAPAAQALTRLADFDLAVPVSPAAAQATLSMLQGPWPETCAVGLVGPGSRLAFEQALRARVQAPESLRIVCAPAQAADSEGLWAALQALLADAWSGSRVLILRGGNGRDWLAETLQAAGAEVLRVDVYRREPPAADPVTLDTLRELLDSSASWLLTASEGVRNLQGLLRAAGMDPAARLASQRALATHARIAAAAWQAGFGRVEVCPPQTEAIVAALHGDSKA